MQRFITREALAMFVFAFILASASTVFAAWIGPTAAPPGNNAAAPINVGATSQVKSGDFWAASIGSDNGFCIGVDCITSWGDAGSWSESGGDVYITGGSVGVGDTTPDGTLLLDVEGTVGATQYCDENGNNCIAAASLGASSVPAGTLCGVATKASCGSTYTSQATCNGQSIVSSCPSGYTQVGWTTGQNSPGCGGAGATWAMRTCVKN